MVLQGNLARTGRIKTATSTVTAPIPINTPSSRRDIIKGKDSSGTSGSSSSVWGSSSVNPQSQTSTDNPANSSTLSQPTEIKSQDEFPSYSLRQGQNWADMDSDDEQPYEEPPASSTIEIQRDEVPEHYPPSSSNNDAQYGFEQNRQNSFQSQRYAGGPSYTGGYSAYRVSAAHCFRWFREMMILKLTLMYGCYFIFAGTRFFRRSRKLS